MNSAFGVTHTISKARSHPDLPRGEGESGRSYESRLSSWLKEDPSRSAGVVRTASSNPAQPPKKAAPKAQPKVETPKAAPKPQAKPAEPKVEAPKPPPQAAAPGNSMPAAPQEVAQPKPPVEKPENTMSRAFETGQKRAFREGKGPIASAWNGVGVALKTHPGKTAAIAGGGAAGLAGAAYLGGRAQQKKRDGR